jgi:hypothetical protein
VGERLRASWSAWWEPFRDELLAAPPAEDSLEERTALARFAVHVSDMMGVFPGDLAKVLQHGIQQTIERLLLQAAENVEVERRLGFHWLQEAVEILGRVIDRFVYVTPAGGMEQAVALLPRTPAEVERYLDRPSTLMLRLELYTFVAWDLVASGTPAEFCSWARKAATAAQQFDAMFPFLMLALESGGQPNDVDLRTETVLDVAGVATVLRLLDDPPGPNEALLRLFSDDDQTADRS